MKLTIVSCLLHTVFLYSPLFAPCVKAGSVFSSYIHAPWRETNTSLKVNCPLGEKCSLKGYLPVDACYFCKELKANQDEKYFILSRPAGFIVQLNPKPYTRGSILIYPTKHIKNISDLSLMEYCDMFLLAQQTMTLLQKKLSVESFSIGMNLGPNATGSNPEHLHLHVIPRYPKEANGFLETCCNTKLIQYDLQKLYKELTQ